MQTIEVDFDVFKELTMRRSSEEVTYNDVIRDLLELSPKNKAEPFENSGGEAWVQKGVSFPHGTEFRSTYKGRLYEAVVEDGALVMDGKRFESPFGAAGEITKSFVNGWRFWECKMPGSDSWKPIHEYRR